jgi:hypothetical protein
MKQCTPDQYRIQTSSGVQETCFEDYKQNGYFRSLVSDLKAKFRKVSIQKISIPESAFKAPEAYSRFYNALSIQETALPLSLTFETMSREKEEGVILSMANDKQISANSRITLSKGSPNSSMELSRKWIKENHKKYSGKWIVLQGDQLLAFADSSEELVKTIDLKEGKGRFITVVY